MADVGWEAHVAVYAALNTALSGTATVHDGTAPQNTAYPYVTISQSDAAPTDFLNSYKTDRLITLTVWSDYPGSKEVQAIIATINTTLHQQKLTMTAGTMVRSIVERQMARPDIDGETFQGTVVVRVITEHT
jgi:hypothetical protein